MFLFNISTNIDEHTDTDMIDLVSEMEIMKVIGYHVNIINLIGCCTQVGPLYLMIEYAANGNLRDFLRLRRSSFGFKQLTKSNLKCILTQKDLISFACQIAKGMKYLVSRKVIC